MGLYRDYRVYHGVKQNRTASDWMQSRLRLHLLSRQCSQGWLVFFSKFTNSIGFQRGNMEGGHIGVI